MTPEQIADMRTYLGHSPMTPTGIEQWREICDIALAGLRAQDSHERGWRECREAAAKMCDEVDMNSYPSRKFFGHEYAIGIRALAYPGDAQRGNDQRGGNKANAASSGDESLNDSERNRVLPNSIASSTPHPTASEQESQRAMKMSGDGMRVVDNVPVSPAPLAARSAVEEVNLATTDGWSGDACATDHCVALRHARRLDALKRAMKEINQRVGSARVEGVIMAIQQRAAQIEKEEGNG